MNTNPQDVKYSHDHANDRSDFDRLAAHIQILEDKEALRGLMIRGWRALDLKDWDSWIACWAEDAVFEFGPWGVLNGRQAIYDKVVEAETPYLTMQHHILNMHFEVSGDHATGVGYMFFIGVANEAQAQSPFAMGGPYEWEYERQSAGWRMKRQRLGVWWTQGQDAISAFNQAQADAER